MDALLRDLWPAFLIMTIVSAMLTIVGLAIWGDDQKKQSAKHWAIFIAIVGVICLFTTVYGSRE
jgi:glycerol uptake facilitator-like aquaporin